MIEEIIPTVLRALARTAQGVMHLVHSLWPYEWPFGDDDDMGELETEATNDHS